MRLVSQRAAGQTAGTAAVRTQRPGKDPRTRRGRRPSWLDRPITGCGRRRGSPFTARIVTPTAPERCVRAGPTASWALLTGLCLRGRNSRAPRGRDPAPRPPTPARKPRIPYPSPPTPCKLRPRFPDAGFGDYLVLQAPGAGGETEPHKRLPLCLQCVPFRGRQAPGGC